MPNTFNISESEAIERESLEEGYYLKWLIYNADIKPLQKDFEAGHKAALMMCIRLCAEYGLPLPAWAAIAYIEAFDSVRSLKYLSWDDAFGKPYPKYTNASSLKKKIRLASVIWSAVTNERKAGRSIDGGLFEAVGRRHGVGKTLAEEYYYYFIDWLNKRNAKYREF